MAMHPNRQSQPQEIHGYPSKWSRVSDSNLCGFMQIWSGVDGQRCTRLYLTPVAMGELPIAKKFQKGELKLPLTEKGKVVSANKFLADGLDASNRYASENRLLGDEERARQRVRVVSLFKICPSRPLAPCTLFVSNCHAFASF